MKKKQMIKVFTAIAVFILTIVTSNAYAEEVTIEATARTSDGKTIKIPIRAQVKNMRVEAKDEIKAKKQDIKSEIESRKQELETKRTDKKIEMRVEAKAKATEHIADSIKKSTDRLTQQLDRFREIQAKIETRLTKLESQGANTTEARALLAGAITKLTTAETSIGAIANVTVSTEDPRSSLDTVKVAVRSAQDALKDAHNSLSNVLPAMKGLQASVKRSATSTKDSN
ncbi:MAG: hypothetical protein AAB484_02430 [Patescibacteria group bacterium]